MKLILCGGGWAEKTVIPNKIFESLIKPDKPILYIPQARDRDPEGYITCKPWLLGEFKDIKHGEIDTVESLSEVANKNLSDYAAIFIGGGNTFKLLKELKESGAFNKIQEYINNNGLVYGCSAGACIFGKDIEICLYAAPNLVALKDTSGFNSVFGCSLAAHYTNKNAERTQQATDYLTEYSHKEPVIALPEEDSLYINGDTVEVIGTRPYYVFNKGNRAQFEPNVKYKTDEFIKTVKAV